MACFLDTGVEAPHGHPPELGSMDRWYRMSQQRLPWLTSLVVALQPHHPVACPVYACRCSGSELIHSSQRHAGDYATLPGGQ